jgi:hypothetical protein
MSGKGIVNSTAMPSAIVTVSSRIAAMFTTTTALAAETSISDGMLALVGTTTAAAYWYDSDAVSGDVLSAMGGYWKLLAYDTASLAATGGAALVGTARASTVEAELTALLTDAQSATDDVWVPIKSLTWDTGAAIAPFVDNTTDGYTAASTECQGIRWNNDTAPRITVAGEFHVPATWNDLVAVVGHFQGFRVGAADAAMVLTVTAFAQEVGDEFDADANAGGNTTAFDGATKVITDETITFAAGVLPAGSKVSFTAVADAALDNDDFVLTGIRFVGTRKLRSS